MNTYYNKYGVEVVVHKTLYVDGKVDGYLVSEVIVSEDGEDVICERRDVISEIFSGVQYKDFKADSLNLELESLSIRIVAARDKLTSLNSECMEMEKLIAHRTKIITEVNELNTRVDIAQNIKAAIDNMASLLEASYKYVTRPIGNGMFDILEKHMLSYEQSYINFTFDLSTRKVVFSIVPHKTYEDAIKYCQDHLDSITSYTPSLISWAKKWKLKLNENIILEYYKKEKTSLLLSFKRNIACNVGIQEEILELESKFPVLKDYNEA